MYFKLFVVAMIGAIVGMILATTLNIFGIAHLNVWATAGSAALTAVIVGMMTKEKL